MDSTTAIPRSETEGGISDFNENSPPNTEDPTLRGDEPGIHGFLLSLEPLLTNTIDATIRHEDSVAQPARFVRRISVVYSHLSTADPP